MRNKAISLCGRVLLMTAVVSAAFLLLSGRVDAAAKIKINKTNFPDATFRAYVSANFDADKDGYLNSTEIQNVKVISVNSRGITDLKGIEYFTSLEELECRKNKLTALDISNNLKLKILRGLGNSISELDVSKNLSLEFLECSSNNLSNIDVSKNTALTDLYCGSNNLTTLDVSKNTDLRVLECSWNQLTNIDVSKNSSLAFFSCYVNQLKTLDVTKNTNLDALFCDHNQLKSLDVSNNVLLDRLECTSNFLKTLDLSNNPLLEWLDCGYNQLTVLDVSKNTKLVHLSCVCNYLSAEPQVDFNIQDYHFDPQYKMISVKSQPKDYTGPVGDTASFSVDAQGERLSYQWQTYINGAWKNSSLTGAKSSVLSVPITMERDGYKFRCVIKDAGGMKVYSNTATLHSLMVAAITTQPKDYTGAVGSAAKFTVVADGLGLKYQWQTYVNGAWKDSSLTGAKTATLSVPVTKARDGYKFRCVVTDTYGKTATSKAVVLHVTEPVILAITTQPKNYTGPVGSTATFKVKAQGTGLKYQWQTYKNGKWVNSSLNGAATTTLTVPVNKARDGYKFRCVVTDASGNRVASKSVTLKVG